MKIALAQIYSDPSDLSSNVDKHKHCISLAAEHSVDMVCFPELSLTSYYLIRDHNARRTQWQQALEDVHAHACNLSLQSVIGIPEVKQESVFISSAILNKDGSRTSYMKQFLHDDEKPFFIAGDAKGILTAHDCKIGLAICYESLLTEHVLPLLQENINLYLAMLAKDKKGMLAAVNHYSELAATHKMPVACVNAVGQADGFICAGRTTVWDENGEQLLSLSDRDEAMLIFDSNLKGVRELRI